MKAKTLTIKRVVGAVCGCALILGVCWGTFNISNLFQSKASKASLLQSIWAHQWAILPVKAQVSGTCNVEYATTDKAPTGNQSFNDAAALANYTGQSLLVRNVTNADGPPTITVAIGLRDDYYRLDNAQLYYRYTVKAVPDKTINYDLGIIVYDKYHQPIITDSNPFDGNSAQVILHTDDYGPYFFRVFQRSEQCKGSTYSLILSSAAPTSTPTPTSTPVTPTPKPETPTPVPTWVSGFDKYEPNYDFGNATTIAPGVEYSMNFIPWGGWNEDNDFLKVWVKPGLIFTCETYDLAPALDTNIIIYNGPSTDQAIGGNDDRELGDYSSRVSYYSTYEGYLYLLVGHGGRISGPDVFDSNYKFRCERSLPGTPVVTSTPPPAGATATPVPSKDQWPTATPRPAEPTATAEATATPPPPTPTSTPEPPASTQLTVRPIKTPTPVVPTPTPPGFRTFRVLIYYDENEDNQLGAGEGISGFFVRVQDPASSASGGSGDELAHGYTDEQGQLSLTVPTVKTVRVLVPLLGFDRLVEPSIPEVVIRIAPSPLPDNIP